MMMETDDGLVQAGTHFAEANASRMAVPGGNAGGRAEGDWS